MCFRHLGGRTGKWAEAASADDVVGIMGLGRGKLIQRPQWLIVGDEAAFPQSLGYWKHRQWT
jgi:ferric-chelate reductase (NADPH)